MTDSPEPAPHRLRGGALLRPAVALMNRLKYPQKFFLISLLFGIPLAMVLWFFLWEVHERIEFSRKETLGTRYLRPLARLIQQAQESRALARVYAAGDRTVRPALLRKQQEDMDKTFSQLEAEDADLGETLDSTSKLRVLRKNWEFLKSQTETLPARDTEDLHKKLVDEMRRLMSRVGDTSNLILDPDLDTYYLMDALLLKLPEAEELLHQARFKGEEIASRRQMTADERAELIVLAGLIRTNLESMMTGIDVAFANNPSGTLRPQLDKPYREFDGLVKEFLGLLDSQIIKAEALAITPEALVAATRKPLIAARSLWDGVVREFDVVAHLRMGISADRRTFVWISTVIVLAFVAYLYTAFYAGVMRTVSSLEEASQRMLSGAVGVTIALESRDEMARVAESFNAVASRLRHEWEQAHEESRRAREAENALRVAELKYRSIVENATEGIFQTSSDGRYLSANPALARIYGYASAEELMGSLMDISKQLYVDPERRVEFERLIEQRGFVTGFESQVRRKDGSVIWILENARAVRDPEGQFLRYEGSVVDINARRNAEEALMRSEEQYRDLFESANDLIQSVATDGRILYTNRSWRETLGYQERDITRLGFLNVVRPDFVPAAEAILGRLLEGGEAGRAELALVAKDGRSILVEGSMNCRRVDGRAVSIRAIFRDVTERKRAEQELQKAKEAAEEANRAKSHFLANMSHELRTPLNSVIGFSNILLKNKAKNLQAQDLAYLQRVQDNGKHLLGLINSILDLSKVEAGKMELNLSPVPLDALVRETIAQLEGRLAEKDVRLLADLPPVVDPIEADSDKLKQVLINLIGNALKFTEHGAVTVRVAVEAGTQRPTRLEVVDTGPGIPSSMLERIFEAFQQADSSTTRKYGGTGLGLTISRALCRLMGYRLEAQSTVGQGSTFSIILGAAVKTATVPALQPFPGPETPAMGGLELSGRTILVIDDEADSQYLLSQFLFECGGTVLVAASGAEGLRKAREHKPDLITLDLMMPQMNGWDILKELKADPDLRDVPVVVVSIVAQENRGTIFGAADILNKPVTRESLCEMVRRYVPVEKGKVLVVDDDPDARRIAAEYLSDLSAEIRMAENGREALDVLRTFAPDLIVLDLMMPVMDGFTFLDELRRQSPHGGPAVVVATAKELTLKEVQVLNEAVSVILKKGADLRRDLDRAVRNALRAKRDPAPAATAPIRFPAEKTIIRVRRMVADLVPGFLQNRHTDVKAIGDALGRGDFEAIRVIGHNMKGIGSAYGFEAVTHIGGSIEEASKAGDAEEIRRHADSLADFLSRVETVPE